MSLWKVSQVLDYMPPASNVSSFYAGGYISLEYNVMTTHETVVFAIRANMEMAAVHYFAMWRSLFSMPH